MHPDISSVSFSAEEIRLRVSGMGLELYKEYHDKRPLFICVLKGAFIFCADLVKACAFPIEVDFIRASSYGPKTVSSGEVALQEQIPDVSGRHVLVLEDILDTGTTLKAILDKLNRQNPLSLKICAFLDKPERRIENIECDYVGFTCGNEFFVGYGLDYNERYRNLADIGVLKRGIYRHS